jgi:hypothetical protein
MPNWPPLQPRLRDPPGGHGSELRLLWTRRYTHPSQGEPIMRDVYVEEPSNPGPVLEAIRRVTGPVREPENRGEHQDDIRGDPESPTMEVFFTDERMQHTWGGLRRV